MVEGSCLVAEGRRLVAGDKLDLYYMVEDYSLVSSSFPSSRVSQPGYFRNFTPTPTFCGQIYLPYLVLGTQYFLTLPEKT